MSMHKIRAHLFSYITSMFLLRSLQYDVSITLCCSGSAQLARSLGGLWFSSDVDE